MSLCAQLDQLRGKFVDLIFPPQCVGCGREGSFLCPSCERALPRLMPPVCSRCGRSLVLEDSCPFCSRWRLQIDGIRSLFLFQDLIRHAIHQLKYGNFKALAAPFGRLLAESLAAGPLSVDTAVPVPLHPRRLRQRGYNQAGLLASEVGRITGVTVVDGSLTRARNTSAQTEAASAEARRRNVHGAFSCIDSRLAGKKVLLIDDVCTTGATLDACAVAVKSAGADSVWGLTLAREE